MNTPIVVFAGYDPNDPTMRLCRENWRNYAARHPDISFVVNCVDSNLGFGTYAVSNGDVRLGYKEIIGEGNHERPYEEWGPNEWAIGRNRWILLLTYLFEKFPEPFWAVYTNITGFICFERLTEFLSMLECRSVYAGLPIYYIPDDFIYIAGSHTIFSSDTLKIVFDYIKDNPPSPDASDITIGRSLLHCRKLMIPIGNFLSNDFPEDSSLVSKTTLAQNYVNQGYFFFRYKNYYPGIPREHIDPFLQSFTMGLCQTIPPDLGEITAKTKEFGLRMQRMEGMACVGSLPRQFSGTDLLQQDPIQRTRLTVL